MTTRSRRGRSESRVSHQPPGTLEARQNRRDYDQFRTRKKNSELIVPPANRLMRGFRRRVDPAQQQSDRFVDHSSIPTEKTVPVTYAEVNSWFYAFAEGAADSENELPSRDVVEEANRIALGLRDLLPAKTDVYAWDDGGIAVGVFGFPGREFRLVLEPDGSALCVVLAGQLSRRTWYVSTSKLPDSFLREGLQDVRSGPEPAYPPETALLPVVQEFSRGVDDAPPRGSVVQMADRIVSAALIYTTGTHITFDNEEGYLDFHLRLSDGLLVMANVFPDGGIDASVYDDSQGPPVRVVRRMRRGTTTDEELVVLFRAGIHASSS